MSAHPDDLASVTAANRDRLMGLAAAIFTITNSERHMIDLADLEAKALAATQGEWECRHGDEVWLAIEGDIGRHVATADREEDAAYIVAAQPSVVLELIERIRAAEAKAGEPVAWVLPVSAASDARIAELEAEVERLRAQSETMRNLLHEADKRIVWEHHGLGHDFTDRVEAALND